MKHACSWRPRVRGIISAGIALSVAGGICAAADLNSRIEHYEILRQRSPRDASLRKQLAVLYHNRAQERAQQHEWLPAIADAEQALRLEPQEHVIRSTLSILHNNFGLILRGRQEYAAALTHLKAARSYDPESVSVKKNLAAVYLDLAQESYTRGRTHETRHYLGLAVENDTQNPHIYILSGELAYQNDQYDTALADWTTALALDPDAEGVRRRLEKVTHDRARERGFSVRESGIFNLKIESGIPPERSAALSDILRQAYRDIGADFGFFPEQRIPVIVYAAKTHQAAYLPDWAAGAYDGKIRLRADAATTGVLTATLYHEYTHAVVFYLGGPQVPLWLNEGLAEYQAKRFLPAGQRANRRKMLLQAVRTNTLFPFAGQLSAAERDFLDTLERRQIDLVYAQAESFVSFLINRYSLDTLRRVLVRLLEGDSPGKAMEDILHSDLGTLEQSWRQTLSSQAGER